MADKTTILIIEDEKPLAHALELKLNHSGFETIVAANGQAGLDIIMSQDVDVVLLDLMMPVLDGFQVLEAMKNAGKNPYTIVLSNLSQHEDEVRARDLGARDFYVKSNTSLSTIVDVVTAAK